jgi:hypothetical protein
VDLYNECLSAVLSPMKNYFAEHFGKANACFVGMTSGKETEKEHARSSHAVCSSYFKLLHTLTSFSDSRILLGEMLTGHSIVSLVHHIACSELHGAHDRAVAIDTLYNFIRCHQEAWSAMCFIPSPLNVVFGGGKYGTVL